MTPVLEKLADKNSDSVRILKVNAAENRSWAAEQNVRGVPTFQFYSNRVRLEQFSGAYPQAKLQEKIDKYVDSGKGGGSSSGGSSKKPSEPTIKPMPKDWLPEGVERSRKKSS